MDAGAGKCPICGAERPVDTPEGPCPRCATRGTRIDETAELEAPTSLITPGSGDVAEPWRPDVDAFSTADGPSTDPSDLTSDWAADAEETTLPADDDSAAHSLSMGATIRYFGDYEILREIARGGMGVVFQARQVSLNRVVALKMIRAGELADDSDVKRFHVEAEAAARLDHPGIVPIFEVGQHEGQHYFSMGFVEGQSLGHRLAEGPLPGREAALVMLRVSEAMEYAHRRGVVHRDLKPANILLDRDNTPRVTDFGLAKQLASDSGLTGSGQVMGTPSYMPPEQASGRRDAVGPAADVYAMGATLYALVTGRPPFQAATPIETIRQMLHDEPVPPRRLNPALDRDIETICLKCLEKEPERRYATAAALADDLRRFLGGEPILARPVGPIERGAKWVKRNRVVTAAAAAVVLALAAGTTVSYLKYLDAEEQRGIAEVKRQDADTQKGIALARENEARQEADKARKARDFLIGILQLPGTGNRGGNRTAREILADAETSIPIRFAGQPELRAELETTIAEVKRGIGRTTPQAMILEVGGAVRLQSAAGADRAAVSQGLVNLDDRLTVPPDAGVQLVFLSDFHKERIRPGRSAAVDWTGCEPPDAILERDDSPLMTFVGLPKGSFPMGWDGRTPGVRTEIREDFEIAVHDVTQGQWRAVMGNNPSWFRRDGGGSVFIGDISDEELKLFPVESVTWDDAQEFVRKLNDRERGKGWLYRLPTEAEWEYACRAGATSEDDCSYQFYFDRPAFEMSTAQANFDGERPSIVETGRSPVPPGQGLSIRFGAAQQEGQSPHSRELKGKSLHRPTRVGAYPPNRLGLRDMQGNVWQWCADLFSGSSRRPAMARGGSWKNLGAECRAAYRFGGPPHEGLTPFKAENVGFRLVRVRAASGPALAPALALAGEAPREVDKRPSPGNSTTMFIPSERGPVRLTYSRAGAPAARNSAPARVQGIDVTVGRLETWKESDPYNQPVGGPRVFLTLSGPGLAGAKGIRTVIGDVRDDGGALLRRWAGRLAGYVPGMQADDRDDGGKFRPLRRPTLGGGAGEQVLDFYTPATARSIRMLAGRVELVIPSKDPASTITASFADDAGRPLSNVALKAAGVEILLQRPGPAGTNQLSYSIKDPGSRIVAVEFLDDRGRRLEPGGHFSAGMGDAQTVGFSFNSPISAAPVAKFHVITEKSVVAVPFEFRDVLLPQQ